MKSCSLLALLLPLLSLACRKSAFDLAHDKAVSENPAGVELRIATLDGKQQFRLSEPIPIEEFYTAKYPNQWHIEVMDGWNEASVSDEAYSTDGHISFVVDERMGIICCDSRHVWLDPEPLRLPLRTDSASTFVPFRFPKTGKYHLYVTSYRVFDPDQNLKTYAGRGYPTTSTNILTIQVN